MSLKIELRPLEVIQIGNVCRLSNGNNRSVFAIDGSVLVLREKHILKPTDVVDNISRLYYLVQEMGLNEMKNKDVYQVILAEMLSSDGMSNQVINDVYDLLAADNFYSALNLIRKYMFSANDKQR
jgi:flagellar biosynthesis regulator FlbT